MTEYINTYINSVRIFMDEKMASASYEELAEIIHEFERKIEYFQHERLIHLIVTVLFAIMEIMSIYVTAVTYNVTAVILSIMFLILLVPYVMHYYFLENSVQKMYRMRDELISALKRFQADKL